MVRCKFKCTVKEVNPNDGNTAHIKLEPVMANSEENKLFFKYTPWGSLEMGTINEEAAKQFEIGKEYYIDISQA